jgi:dihydrofolate reductase
LIGGAELYLAGLSLASKLYITEIALAPEGDAFFQDIDAKLWSETSREAHTSEQGLVFSYVTYTRNS